MTDVLPCIRVIFAQHDIDASVFGHDLGLSLGLNPRISIASASTVRAQEGTSVNKLIAQDDHSRIHHDEPMVSAVPLISENSSDGLYALF